MEKTYHPQHIEAHWYEKWEQAGAFTPSGEGPSYCIMIPPPNVTGTLHMGHGFQVTLQDALIRYHRMQGYNTLWQVGTDHAGIATQMVVERQLHQKGLSAREIGRDNFENKIWAWTQSSVKNIRSQLRRLGASVDWSRERFTLDESMSHAVRHVFIQLYQEGLIYRDQALVNWDPHFQTALSDLEVESHEEQGQLWYFSYPIKGSQETVTIATTRPETMLGDTAVAVHPNDERYQSLIGKTIVLPLTEREIPIIADVEVDPEFGTGCVKITPAHDFNDYVIGKRHDLPMINILTESGALNDQVPEPFQGLDRFEARDAVVEALKQQNRLVKIESHALKVPRGDRSNAVVEPYLTNQWFVKMQPLAQAAKRAAEQGELHFIPENWINTYNQWLDNIEDWCISRQLWWGHRIPAWYDSDQNIYVGDNEAAVRSYYELDSSEPLWQDESVLDTWFSSALWPFSTLGWPENTQDFQTFYPTQVLVTGFDIIFFWVARMVMMGLKFTQTVPFKDVYITGLIRDQHGQKMSKSKGNVIDPIDLVEGIDLEHLIAKRTQHLMQPQKAKQIEKMTRQEFPHGIPSYGTDALRFTFCALASPTRHINFDIGRLEGYRNFCNKLWNAARYVFMQMGQITFALHHNDSEYTLADRWIRSRLDTVIQQTHKAFSEYRFDRLAENLYNFIWHQYCDWYLELSKTVLNVPEVSESRQRGTAQTLIFVLETTLRLLHPIMPFITEAIWQKAATWRGISDELLCLQTYPQSINAMDEATEAEMAWLQNFVIEIRNIRGEMNISPQTKVTVLLTKGEAQDQNRVETLQAWLKAMAGVERIEWTKPENIPALSATGLVGALEIYVPFAEYIDVEAECQRLEKEIQKLTKTIQRSEDKLNNPNFVNKAPGDVVINERQRLKNDHHAIEKLKARLQKLKTLSNIE